MTNAKKAKAFIFGSGSIACRHSRILSQFGFRVTCISSRDINLSELFHPNEFSEIRSSLDKSEICGDDIIVIAASTHLHSELVENMIADGIAPNKIFCEKPGPDRDFGVQILYNLEYLRLPENLGAPLSFVHLADAKKWPSDLDWSERYIFRRKLGGGVWLTHSHELARCFYSEKPDLVKIKKASQHGDIDSETVCLEANAEIDHVKFFLSLVAQKPLRYWHYENCIIHFYGDIPTSLNDQQIYYVSAEEVAGSYVTMWKERLSCNVPKKQPDLSWIHALA